MNVNQAPDTNFDSVEDLLETYFARFDMAVQVLFTVADVSFKDHLERHEIVTNHHLERNLPNFDCTSLALWRKKELELVNFHDSIRGLRHVLREQLINDITIFHFEMDESIEQFDEHTADTIKEERQKLSDSVNENHKNSTMKYTRKITTEVRKFEELRAGNALSRGSAPANDAVATGARQAGLPKSSSVQAASSSVAAFVDASMANTANLITSKINLAKKFVDRNLLDKVPLCDTTIACLAEEIREAVSAAKKSVHRHARAAGDCLSAPDALFVEGTILLQQADAFAERIDKAAAAAIKELTAYRLAERKAAVSSEEPDLGVQSADAWALAEESAEVLPDGRYALDSDKERSTERRVLLDLGSATLSEDGVIEVHGRQSLLKALRADIDDTANLAVLAYRNDFLLKCRGVGALGEDARRFLVYDHYPHTLASRMGEGGRRLNRFDFIQFSNQLVLAVQYLHEEQRFHGDLRPENVFFAAPKNGYEDLKLAHFSLAEAGAHESRGAAVLSPFTAPELRVQQESTLLLLQKADIWSLAALFWFSMTGFAPPPDAERPLLPEPGTCIRSLRALLEACWSAQPEERPSIDEFGEVVFGRVLGELMFDAEAVRETGEVHDRGEEYFDEQCAIFASVHQS